MSDVFDHLGIKVADIEKAKAFYSAVLGTIGLQKLVDFDHGGVHYAAFGRSRPDFWISTSDEQRGGIHLAFVARSRAEVNAFHAVATSMGGRDNGAPGLRARYHPNYYGAFVFDLDGNNIEAVCHVAE